MRKLGSVPLPALESAQLQIRALQRELAIATARVELESELREPLYERIAELEARLEIHHLDENGNAHIDEQHDGIYCRDETIRMQDERIAELKARMDAWFARYVIPAKDGLRESDG